MSDFFPSPLRRMIHYLCLFLSCYYKVTISLPSNVAFCLCAIFCSVILSKIQSQLRVHLNTSMVELRPSVPINGLSKIERRKIFHFKWKSVTTFWLTAAVCSILFCVTVSSYSLKSRKSVILYSSSKVSFIIGGLLWHYSQCQW